MKIAYSLFLRNASVAISFPGIGTFHLWTQIINTVFFHERNWLNYFLQSALPTRTVGNPAGRVYPQSFDSYKSASNSRYRAMATDSRFSVAMAFLAHQSAYESKLLVIYSLPS